MDTQEQETLPGLYDPTITRAACGVGVVVDLNGVKSHQLIHDGFRVLENIDHRGARGAEEKTGDGTGMMLQKPHEFFAANVEGLGDFDSYGVGMIYMPRDYGMQVMLKDVVTKAARAEGFRVVTWRNVPTNNSDLGKTALETEPVIMQVFVEPLASLEPAKLDTKLYVLRRVIENMAKARGVVNKEIFYICSLDRRKIVYKGLLSCGQLEPYFPELSDPLMKTSLVLLHSRFSTNTLGAWHLAHPYRNTVHNGEINTLRGNLNRMKTREAVIASERFGKDIEKLKPITGEGMSDTAVFDNVLELLLEAGRELPHALRMLIPEAWHKDAFMEPRRREFYDYFSTIIEPWDGPALVAVTDGYRVAAVLDRNGLRPCRYYVTTDNKLVMASETGVLDIPPSDIVMRGRLKPGEIFLADTLQKRIVPEKEIFEILTKDHYGEWLRANRVKLGEMEDGNEELLRRVEPAELVRYQRVFGYTTESLRELVDPMAESGKDPIGAMGTDTPLAVLSALNKPLFSYFQQLFAQVSNPPLDYLREALVTSLESHVGRQHNLLDETAEHCRQVFIDSPILSAPQIRAMRTLDKNGIRSTTVDITYPAGTPLKEALEGMRKKAAEEIKAGAEILILSDRAASAERIPVPSLLAVSGIHHYLIRQGLRTMAGLVLESGQPCGVHHFCTLIGYGADAIFPWLAYQSIVRRMKDRGQETDTIKALQRYRKAVEGGILKVMSKMGISTLESYKGAQVFEAIGLKFAFVHEYFQGTTAHIPTVGLEQIEKEVIAAHRLAYSEKIAGSLPLEQGGEFYWRRDGEIHQWNPFTVGKLQHAVRTGDRESYREFASYINDQEERLQTLRGLLDFAIDPEESIPVSEVEPVEEIFKRFGTGSMSFGALSREAHETLAIAMNRIGGKAGSGEGGEQVERFGTERECSMKQVASGRFGVTMNYLVHAKQIEIKMAQGSKPGEGGELPGPKVDETIAEVRFTTPGVGLISPPPHHDIYSIEDLAQLIHDLKCANPKAEIHVKLVSVANVGTIAAGVAKARADAVLIAGDSGGTGASVKTSIKSAGSAWELGLAETQQVLLATNLRSRIRLRVDGGLKTGRDVVVAALLGAEEYGFGTAPLVAVGCIMLRKCHCNTCSVGVATQDPALRAKFPGTPDHVINYMRFVAEEVRGYMASLGFRTIEEMVGRVDRLKAREVRHPKASKVDLSQLLFRQPSHEMPRKTRDQDHKLEAKIDHQLIEMAKPAIEHREPVRLRWNIFNRDRTAGTMLSSAVTRKHGANGLRDDTVVVDFAGSAGQSFGAFLCRGITLHLEGDANDYVGKGLSGGKITVRVPASARYKAAGNIIIGNVALYGATSGEGYFNGIAGERFAVRNSGAMAVVEGIGDHGCEYMTGGAIVILGRTGKNFGAGMSGGEAFIFDEAGDFRPRLNTEMAHAEEFKEERDVALVRRLIENHYSYTGSTKAKEILDSWEESAKKFVKVIPEAYSKAVDRYLREGKDVRIAPPPKAAEELRAA